MKALLLLLWLGCAAVPQLLATGSSSSLTLEGILGLPGQPRAILSLPASHPGPARDVILGPGQREGDIEVLRIEPLAGKVQARVYPNSQTVILSFKTQTNGLPASVPCLVLDGARLEPVLRFYSLLSGRTLLRWPRLPNVAVNLSCSATNQAELTLRLEQALRDQQIASIPDGKKFLMVVPASEAATVRPRSADFKPGAAVGGSTESLPAGVITFIGADLNQVAPIYASLMGRRLEDNNSVGRVAAPFNLQTQTSLTKDECLYALDTLLGWQRYKIIPVGDDLARLVSILKPGVDAGR